MSGVVLQHRPGASERNAVMRRRWLWLLEQVGWLIGDAACLLQLILFLSLVPVLKAFDDVRNNQEGK